MLSRSSVACKSCLCDPLTVAAARARVRHAAWLLLPPSFVSVAVRLQFSVDSMACSWARSPPVGASSEENCFIKASRASEDRGANEKIGTALSVADYIQRYMICIHFFSLRACWAGSRCVNTLLSLTDSDLTFILIPSVCLFKREINTQFCPHFLQSHFVVLRCVSPGIQLPLTYALLGSLALICAA